jgi:hypothetical protein
LFLLAIIAGAMGAYEQQMFYRAWRRDKIETLGIDRLFYASPFAMLASDLSEECITRRRRARWALVAFFGLMALWAMATLSLHGVTLQAQVRALTACEEHRPCGSRVKAVKRHEDHDLSGV